MIKIVKQLLHDASCPDRKKTNERFFKSAPGEYGYGDVFLGVTMPSIRSIVKQYNVLSLQECIQLLQEGAHEERICALLILVDKYQKTSLVSEKKRIYDLYIQNRCFVNNWDLVDLTAPHILGAYLFELDDFSPLYAWIKSPNLWERRQALLATFYGIRQNRFDEIVALAELVLSDSHDLIHKASGWMLREVGKRERSVLVDFLTKHYKVMPRTMLRYAIEHFEEPLRQDYLKGRM